MESAHTQPLLQEQSESDAENFVESDTREQDDHSITESLDKELLRGGQNVPHDKYSFNYIIFYLMGMTTLMPWNFFITAEDVSHQFLLQKLLTYFTQVAQVTLVKLTANVRIFFV